MISKPTLSEFLRVWTRIGATGFGGPAGQIALMHDEIVERRQWLSDAAFSHALGYCMVLPGPEAQQLATYLGWLLYGRAGGIAAGLLFIVPGWLVVTGLAWLLATFGTTPSVAAVMAGVKPAVVVIVAAAAWRLLGRLSANPRSGAIAAAALAATLSGLLHFALIIALAALAGWLGRDPSAAPDTQAAPDSSAPALHRSLLTGTVLALLLWIVLRAPLTLLAAPLFGDLADFFTRVALVTFGGAYAVLPYVFDVAVREAHWLSPAQMIDGLALGETTPGPLILVNSYVGFMAAWNASADAGQAWLGSLVATVFTFLPSFAFILIGAPWVEKSRNLAWLKAPLAGISAAVVGLIAALGLTFAAHVLWPLGWVDADPTGGLDLRATAVLLALVALRRAFGWSALPLLLAGAALGAALHGLT